MREYLPIFIVLGIIGIFTLGFIAAYVRESTARTARARTGTSPTGRSCGG